MRKWLLPGIIFLAFLLRVLWLDKFPFGFTPDEASFGYDAYSLLKTGKDQWGKSLPLVLESFGDFKPPLYAYLTIPSVAVFGLTKFATRLPNALLGTAAVYVTYLLVTELVGYGLRVTGSKLKTHNALTRNRLTELTAALLLAISPWHVMMSRGAFEANLTTFLLPLGIYLFFRGMHPGGVIQIGSRNRDHTPGVGRYLVWSAFIFGLNLFSYHSAKLVTPLLVLFLIFLYKKHLLKIEKKYLIKAFCIFSFFIGLTVYSFTKGAGARVVDISVFGGALEAQAEARLSAINDGMNPAMAKMFHNKYQVALGRFWNNYKQYYSYKFLFKDGPAEATYGMIPGRGVLYFIELLFLIGFIFAFVKNRKNKVLQIIFLWLIIAPIPAALTMGVGYSANRVAIMMPAIQIASAIGLFWILEFLKKKYSGKVAKGFVKIVGFVLIISSLSFAWDYFILSPANIAQSMLYGNLEAIYWLKQNVGCESILVSTRLSEPHIYIAFANRWDPKEYQTNTKNWEGYRGNFKFLDQLGSYSLGNYLFEKIDTERIEKYDNFMLVGRPDEFPINTVPQKIFKYPNGESAIYVVSPNNENFATNKTY